MTKDSRPDTGQLERFTDGSLITCQAKKKSVCRAQLMVDEIRSIESLENRFNGYVRACGAENIRAVKHLILFKGTGSTEELRQKEYDVVILVISARFSPMVQLFAQCGLVEIEAADGDGSGPGAREVAQHFKMPAPPCLLTLLTKRSAISTLRRSLRIR